MIRRRIFEELHPAVVGYRAPDGYRLGRHVEHDPRSRAFRVNPSDTEPASKAWERRTVFDQGLIGSCTGNAVVGIADTVPFRIKGGKGRPKPPRYNEALALAVYKRATVIDGFDGEYPPDDTGSSGLAACKAAVEHGLASGYLWGFGIDDLRKTVAELGPCAVGTEWRTGMDRPDSGGLLHARGAVRGGHEYEVVGWHADRTLGAPLPGVFECQNSWGAAWGVAGTHGKGGRFFIPHDEMAELLAADGDCVTLKV